MPLSHPQQTTAETEKLLSVQQVARELGVSVTTGYELCWSNQIPSVKIGRRRMIRRSDLIYYIESLGKSGG